MANINDSKKQEKKQLHTKKKGVNTLDDYVGFFRNFVRAAFRIASVEYAHEHLRLNAVLMPTACQLSTCVDDEDERDKFMARCIEFIRDYCCTLEETGLIEVYIDDDMDGYPSFGRVIFRDPLPL